MSGAGEATSGSVSVHAGPDGWAHCKAYDDGQLPVLLVHGDRVRVMVHLSGEAITADHLRFATELAEAARKLAAECERLHAAQHPRARPGRAA